MSAEFDREWYENLPGSALGDESPTAGASGGVRPARGGTGEPGPAAGGGTYQHDPVADVGASAPPLTGQPAVSGALRKVARVLLLDPQDRILLLHGHEPEDPADHWWFTPGGGLEGDETRRQAALRELAEETGITDVELGPVLWRRTCSFPFAGQRWDQDEWYFLARTAQTATAATALTALERRSLAGARWWTCQELARAHETVYPTKLAELLRRLLDEGPPGSPEVLKTHNV